MTKPTPHGQVPEALIDLIDAYAETRHRCGGVYNAKTEAARNAVIEALSVVQALSAAPEAFLKSVIALCSHRGYSPANIEAWDKYDKWIADLWRQAEAMLAASPTPPAEQAAPKAVPGEQDDHQILAITTAYEQGVGKGHQAHESGKEIANPYDSTYRCDLAWQYGYGEGKEQAQRATKAAPQQEAQEPIGHLRMGPKEEFVATKRAEELDIDVWHPVFTAQPAPQQESQEPAAWESTILGYIKYITQAQYEKFRPNVRRWYKPYKCSSCAAPQPAPDCHHRPQCDECAALAAQRGNK